MPAFPSLCLDELHEDIVLSIFSLTDVCTVLTVLSRVNTRFHAIAYTKQLWVLLIKDLLSRGLIDVPSDEILEVLSTAELIGEIKRTVFGPRTWSPDPPTAPTSPTLIRQFIIESLGDRVSFVRLLPGGRYLAIRRKNDKDAQLLEFWAVSTGLRVWTWTPRTGFQILVTEFDVCHGSTVMVVLTLCDASSNLHALILEAHLESGQSREILQIPSADFVGMPFIRPQITGHYFVSIFLNIDHRRWISLLVNWRTEEYIALSCPDTQADFQILPGYIFLTSQLAPLSIRIHAISSLQEFWRPLSDLSLRNTTSESAITPASILPVSDSATSNTPLTFPFNLANYHYHEVKLFVAESILRPDTYLLRVVHTDSPLTVTAPDPRITMTASIHRLEFLEARSTPRFTSLSTFTPAKGLVAVSRAGYGLDRILPDKNVVCVIRQDEREGKFINFDGMRHADLSRNGALMVLYQSRAEINYYE
ncbi:F-box domain-containing protein [Mycena venus]|uniref:F-box domain-containing protein n=1 Tax=Mycena venus TaxID=2733690 RepID=A0A8H6XY47_9AGAR|nr:F-box domain-containing protein [Mycena venus]